MGMWARRGVWAQGGGGLVGAGGGWGGGREGARGGGGGGGRRGCSGWWHRARTIIGAAYVSDRIHLRSRSACRCDERWFHGAVVQFRICAVKSNMFLIALYFIWADTLFECASPFCDRAPFLSTLSPCYSFVSCLCAACTLAPSASGTLFITPVSPPWTQRLLSRCTCRTSFPSQVAAHSSLQLSTTSAGNLIVYDALLF